MNKIFSILTIFVALCLIPNTAEAQKWVFPQNHTDVEWYTLETEHFAFHYPVSKDEDNPHYLTAEYSARRFATIAESNWYDMCEQFNYFLKERIHVLVLNQGDDLQGFTIPSWDWIVMSANPGGGYFSYSRGRMEWFSTVFAHEFAHVVSLKAYRIHSEGTFTDIVGGLYENGINREVGNTSLNHFAIGVEVPITDSDSVFWVEGGAEYWSGNTNVNWWTTARDRTIRASLLEERLLTYDEWHHKVTTGWNDGERWYQGGHSFALYMRERFGPNVFAQFALEYSKRWRPQFENVIEVVVGVDAETLYDDWLLYITEQYDSQVARVQAKGEVVGLEMLDNTPGWEYSDPKGRDKWLGTKKGIFGDNARGWFGRKTKREGEAQKEATGLYVIEPRVSQDGNFIGKLDRYTIKIDRYDRESVRAFTGSSPSDPGKELARTTSSFRVPYGTFDHGWDFVPNEEAIVLTGREDNYPRGLLQEWSGMTFELDGYDWNQLYYFKYPDKIEQRFKDDTIKTRTPSKGFANKTLWHGEWTPIPNTKRGHDPAVSPSGEEIAFLEYTDGTVNLATINLDGSEKNLLTSYNDGTWMRTVDWSPDGEQLIISIHRNFQQNLYIMNKDGSDLTALMMDEWEEQDPHWSAVDGRIYFSADPDGIANIFSYDPADKSYRQITNVINGAYAPQITSDGDLVYLYYTAHGWKIYGLPRAQFLNSNSTEYFNTPFTDVEVSEFMVERLDYSHFDNMTSKYKARKAISSPVFIPMYRMTNDSRTSWGISAGAQMQLMDYAQYQQGFAFALLGEDTIIQAGYTNDMFVPSLFAYAGFYQGKFDQGFLLDTDNDPETTDDQSIYEVRRNQSQRFFGTAASYQWNSRLTTSMGANGFDFSLKSIDSTEWERFMWSVSTELSLLHSNNQRLSRTANPYYGHTFEAAWRHGWTDIVYEDYGGVNVDDGELLDNYQYNQYEARYTKMFRIPAFGFDFLRQAQKRKHVIQLDTQMGYVDRNVVGNDEFRAGGRHPYNFGYGSIQPNTPFAGYPAWSLGGETMLIANMAYRLPLTKPEEKWMYGPLYLTGVVAQVGGTAGNLWSFRPPADPSEYYRSRYDQRIAIDTADIRREVPFKDIAYKNGNKMLYDLSFEVRVTSVLYHTMSWDSFFRLAYGFNEVRGWGDVDGDDIVDTNDSAVGDELSNETEPAGFRIYLGLGTGW